MSADEVENTYYTVSTPKAAYWYLAFETDETGSDYALVTQGLFPFDDKPWFNRTKFAFMAGR